MTRGRQVHFFAIPEDIREVLSEFESHHAIKYTTVGLFDQPDPLTLTTHENFPDLGIAKFPDAIGGTAYLMTPTDEVIRSLSIPQSGAGVLFAVDQRSSPNSVVFMPGGFYGDRVLLYGKLSTVSKSATSIRLYSSLASIIKKHFTKMDEYWVGKGAKALLTEGVRLTIGANSPSAYDLKI